MKLDITFTDGSPIEIDDNGMIQLLAETEAKLEHLEPGEAIPFDLANLEFLEDENEQQSNDLSNTANSTMVKDVRQADLRPETSSA